MLRDKYEQQPQYFKPSSFCKERMAFFSWMTFAKNELQRIFALSGAIQG